LSERFGVAQVGKSIGSDVESLENDGEAAGSKAETSESVLRVENVDFGATGLERGSDRAVDGSWDVWVLKESIIVAEMLRSIAVSSSDLI
jgi:hypothetical protein